jgi:ribonuclease P/MRP protein subunit RPP40
MLRGKRGFDKIVWAAQNVLNQALNWEFLDIKDPRTGMWRHLLRFRFVTMVDPAVEAQVDSSPILQHHPVLHDILPSTQLLNDVLIPESLTDTSKIIPPSSNMTFPTEDVRESVYELLEYVDLLQLKSPRVESTDQTDAFISRYSVPGTLGEKEDEAQDVRVLKWEGLIPVQWMLTLLNELMYVVYLCPNPAFLLPGHYHEHKLTF